MNNPKSLLFLVYSWSKRVFTRVLQIIRYIRELQLHYSVLTHDMKSLTSSNYRLCKIYVCRPWSRHFWMWAWSLGPYSYHHLRSVASPCWESDPSRWRPWGGQVFPLILHVKYNAMYICTTSLRTDSNISGCYNITHRHRWDYRLLVFSS